MRVREGSIHTAGDGCARECGAWTVVVVAAAVAAERRETTAQERSPRLEPRLEVDPPE